MSYARTCTSFLIRVLTAGLVVGFLLFSLKATQGSDTSLLRAKVSSPLQDELALLSANPAYDYPLPVIVEVDPKVFSQKSGESTTDTLDRLELINSYEARLTAGQIGTLLRSTSVQYVTLDARIRTTSDLDQTPNTSLATIGAGSMGANGAGIVVAVFDSGIGNHPDLRVKRRIRAAVDFTTGEAVQRLRNIDEYGHGTAVAGIIGGTGQKGIATGVAPEVQYVDVKVVGPDGTGSTSNLIKAIEWVIENRNRYEIRLANMSLGHPPLESYRKDPLCRAVRKMVSAGIVTVVSAGNLGRTKNHPKLWGSITTPGNEPSVITVSAIDTMGTLTHSDDTAAAFASRGPTYKDNLFKPDISAPGKNVSTLLRRGSWIDRNHPELRLGSHYGALSGSSMATAFATGAAALMLQENGCTSRMWVMVR